jgi:RNA polymerase sigma-70 factor (ECF subfamily)
MTDWEELRALMLHARDGNTKAMGRLLTELSPKLRGYIRRNLLRSGQADAEDLLQVTLLAIHTKQHTYDPAQSLAGWVYAIARYKVVDHLRATQRRRADVPLENADQVLALDDHEAAEASLDLTAVLGRLPARTRALIEATKIEGAGMAEVAERAGMSEAAVKVAVHRGLKRLTELFGRSESS